MTAVKEVCAMQNIIGSRAVNVTICYGGAPQGVSRLHMVAAGLCFEVSMKYFLCSSAQLILCLLFYLGVQGRPETLCIWGFSDVLLLPGVGDFLFFYLSSDPLKLLA